MADPCAIETTDLKKNYDGIEAVRGLSLQVPAGSICGFLGRNGAGKTTTMKILLGMARPSGGHASVFGLAADAPAASLEIRRHTGFVSEDNHARVVGGHLARRSPPALGPGVCRSRERRPAIRGRTVQLSLAALRGG